MNEEWFNNRRRAETNPDIVEFSIHMLWNDSDFDRGNVQLNNYDIWLQKIVNTYENLIDAKDRTLSRFLLDVPHVPPEVLDTLREICAEPDRLVVVVSLLFF